MTLSTDDQFREERKVKALEEIAAALRDIVALLTAVQTAQPSADNKPQEGDK